MTTRPKIEQPYYCQIPGQLFGVWNLQCHLHIYYPHPEQQTVIISDMRSEANWFIPYQVEYLINQIIHKFHLNPDLLIWIEHYSPGLKKSSWSNFSQVEFQWHSGKATHPEWKDINQELAQVLAGEALHLVAV
ncbi:hypothetical protein ACN4EK_07100 [Pantanalinema rosaneae CENA516]|uniref:hypothetical protein n=1 Tax=Pantanalinema rosaneae TaxID=1620701 RepID=UPI003D6E8B53